MSVYKECKDWERQALIFTIYYIPSVIYTFKVWGVWYWIFWLIIPIFPIIDSIKALIYNYINT